MGSVYMAICAYKGKSLVKFGTSRFDDPTKRLNSVTKKFNGMKHKCHACYVSTYYKCIEEYLHARLEERRVDYIVSRLNSNRTSYTSKEHYDISINSALDAFKKAITLIEEFPIKPVPCTFCDDCSLYCLSEEGLRKNRRIKKMEMLRAKNSKEKNIR